MRCTAAIAVLALAATAVQAAEREVAETCRDLLAETLGIMRDRPVMKEELATGIMWMRRDAERAWAAGDEARCVALLIQVREFLG